MAKQRIEQIICIGSTGERCTIEELRNRHGLSVVYMIGAKRGNIEILKWGRSEGQNPQCLYSGNANICKIASVNGNLTTLKWLRSQIPQCPWDEYTTSGAVHNNHLDVLIWARDQSPPCPWDDSACRIALRKGYLDILWYLYSNGAPYAAPVIIHANCIAFSEEFGEDWKSGTFALLGQNIKG